MSGHVLVVLADAEPGREEEFNDWYTNRHLDDVLRLDGIVAAQRFVLSDTEPPQKATHRYLAIYEVPDDKLDAAVAALSAAQRRPDEMPISDALQHGFRAWWYSAITERRTTTDGEPASGAVITDG